MAKFYAYLVLSIWSFCITKAQVTCPNGVLIYEKSPATSVRIDTTADRTIEIAANEVPTSKCQRFCDVTPSCTSFAIDYVDRVCKLYSAVVEKSRLISGPSSAFFEKICLPDISESRFRTMCNGKLWATERVRGGSFSGPVVRLEQNVPSRIVCTRLCLSETTFDCASAVFDSIARTCALSTEDRRTQTSAFAENSRSNEYIENQCISDLRDCQYLPENNHKVVSVDYVTIPRNEDQCREDCTKNTAIICRSYSYDVSENNCYLSSDDSISLQGVELPRKEGLRYAERRCRHGGIGLLPGALTNQPFSLTSQNSPYYSIGPQAYPGSRPNYFQGVFDPNGRTIPHGGLSGSSYGGVGAGPQFQNPTQLSPFLPSSGYPYNPNYGNPYYGFTETGRQTPFAGMGFSGNPNNPFLINQAYPGYGGYNQGGAGPFFNTGRTPPPPTNDTPFNSFATPERCTFEKSMALAVVGDLQGPIPITTFKRSVTDQCAIWCKLQGPARCPAFILDYKTNQCMVLNRPANFAFAPGTVHGQSYFEQICFPNNYRSCEGKLWAFERIPRSELRGFDDRVLPSIRSLRECEEACLKETQFLCLSAEYDNSRSECHLSRENRISRAFAFQDSPNVDYVENQCVLPNSFSNNCNVQRLEGQAVFYVDAALPQTYSEDECRRSCQNFPNFTCNAASYQRTTSECLLSSSAATVVQPDAILLHTSCVQPVLVNVNTVPGQNLIPNNQYPTGIPGYGFNPQMQMPMYPNQFYGGFNPTTTGGQLPFNTQPFGQGFQPQNPQFIGVQNGLGGVQPFSNQFPNTATYPTSGIAPGQFPGQTTLSGQYPGQTTPSGQYPVTGQLPGQTISSGYYPDTSQLPVFGHLPGSGQLPNTDHTGSGQLPGVTGQVPGTTGRQFPFYNTGSLYPGSTGQFPGSTALFPGSSGQFPGSSGQFPGPSGQFPGSTGQFQGSAGQFPGSTRQFSEFPGQFHGSDGRFYQPMFQTDDFQPNVPVPPNVRSRNPTRPAVIRSSLSRSASQFRESRRLHDTNPENITESD